jgi:hypothetical protein
MKCLLLTLALGIACAGLALAQTAATPDLSGTWKLNLAKSKLDKHNTITSETLVITSADSCLEFRYEIDGKDYNHRYITDGKERPIAEVLGRQESPHVNTMVKAQWQKSVLVIEQIVRAGNESEVLHLITHWMLSSDGRTLTMNPDSGGKVSYVYDKQ